MNLNNVPSNSDDQKNQPWSRNILKGWNILKNLLHRAVRILKDSKWKQANKIIHSRLSLNIWEDSLRGIFARRVFKACNFNFFLGIFCGRLPGTTLFLPVKLLILAQKVAFWGYCVSNAIQPKPDRGLQMILQCSIIKLND